MSRIVDLTGLIVGQWTVLQEVPRNRYGKRMGLCQCTCGEPALVQHGDLLQEKSTRCTYCRQERLRVTSPTKTNKLYHVWGSMKRRCINPKSKDYPRWGGRGIRVCQRWIDSYDNFVADMGPRPEGASLDRIDNNGDYEPGNCRWATAEEQNNNKRNVVWVEIDGERMRRNDALRIHGTSLQSYWQRIKKGWDPVTAITTPGYKRKRDLAKQASGRAA